MPAFLLKPATAAARSWLAVAFSAANPVIDQICCCGKTGHSHPPSSPPPAPRRLGHQGAQLQIRGEEEKLSSAQRQAVQDLRIIWISTGPLKPSLAERKYCRLQAPPFRLGLARVTSNGF